MSQESTTPPQFWSKYRSYMYSGIKIVELEWREKKSGECFPGNVVPSELFGIIFEEIGDWACYTTETSNKTWEQFENI